MESISRFFQRVFGIPQKGPRGQSHEDVDKKEIDWCRECDREDFSVGGIFGDMDKEMMDFQRQMEQMSQQMEQMFQVFEPNWEPKFRVHVFQPTNFEFRPGIEPPGSPNMNSAPSPRDTMLKNPDVEDGQPQPRVPAIGGIYHPPPLGSPSQNADQANNPHNMIVVRPHNPMIGPGGWSSNFSRTSRSSCSAFRGPDGIMRVEEKQTQKNSSGDDVTIVTRKIGDQSYTVTTTTDKSGVSQSTETFSNMNANDLPKFEERWSSRSHLPSRDSLLKPDDVKPNREGFGGNNGFSPKKYQWDFDWFKKPKS